MAQGLIRRTTQMALPRFLFPSRKALEQGICLYFVRSRDFGVKARRGLWYGCRGKDGNGVGQKELNRSRGAGEAKSAPKGWKPLTTYSVPTPQLFPRLKMHRNGLSARPKSISRELQRRVDDAWLR